MPIRSRAAAFTLGAVTLAASCVLTGCTGTDTSSPSPSATDSTQSVSAACDIVRESVADAAAELQHLDAADPQAAVAAMTAVADRLGTAAAAVDNADVAAALPSLQTGFTKTAEILQAIAGGDLSQLPALQQAAGDIQSSFTEFSELCTAP